MISTVKDREPAKSTVIGRPILLALEDADGTPSFLEKALKFMEEHGGFSYTYTHLVYVFHMEYKSNLIIIIK